MQRGTVRVLQVVKHSFLPHLCSGFKHSFGCNWQGMKDENFPCGVEVGRGEHGFRLFRGRKC